jgi:hypothetical protein
MDGRADTSSHSCARAYPYIRQTRSSASRCHVAKAVGRHDTPVTVMLVQGMHCNTSRRRLYSTYSYTHSHTGTHTLTHTHARTHVRALSHTLTHAHTHARVSIHTTDRVVGSMARPVAMVRVQRLRFNTSRKMVYSTRNIHSHRHTRFVLLYKNKRPV